MAEKVFTSLSLINHLCSFTAFVLVLTFAVVITGAPLPRTDNETNPLSPGDSTLVAKLLLQWTMEEAYPSHQSDALTLEVCKLYICN